MGNNKAELLSKDSYRSDKVFVKPTSESTKQFYLSLYKEYSKGHLTEQEIADKHNLTRQHVNKIIKWAVYYLNSGMNEKVYKRVMLDNLKETEREIRDYMEGRKAIKPEAFKDIMLGIRELRLNNKIIAQIQGILSNAKVDMSDRRKITVVTNDLGRRRRGGGDKEEVDTEAEVVEDALENVRSPAEEKGLELSAEVANGLPEIAGAPHRLVQVITNLLNNAVQFTPAGGRVTIKAREDADDLRVEVMDTGIGIPPEDMPRIFEDFYRGKDVDTKGAGLGLAIAKKIVEAHGGGIWAESPYPESEKGSKFAFTLPKG